jgi:hypothetical protein
LRRTFITIAALTALVGAGCGGGGSPKNTSPAAVVAAAPAKTSAAGTARTSFTVQASGSEDVTTDGTYDFSAHRSTISVDLPSIKGVSLGKVDGIVDKGVLYMKIPSLLADQLGGTEWLKLDLAKATEKVADVDVSGVTRAASGDPGIALENLKGATAVTAVGDERVRGDLTTHYRATIDTAKAIDAASSDQKDALSKADDVFGTKTVPAEIWIDREGRMRRLRLAVDTSKSNVPGASTVGGQGAVIYELYDFGTTVKAALPPSDKTADLADVVPG